MNKGGIDINVPGGVRTSQILTELAQTTSIRSYMIIADDNDGRRCFVMYKSEKGPSIVPVPIEGATKLSVSAKNEGFDEVLREVIVPERGPYDK